MLRSCAVPVLSRTALCSGLPVRVSRKWGAKFSATSPSSMSCSKMTRGPENGSEYKGKIEKRTTNEHRWTQMGSDLDVHRFAPWVRRPDADSLSVSICVHLWFCCHSPGEPGTRCTYLLAKLTSCCCTTPDVLPKNAW